METADPRPLHERIESLRAALSARLTCPPTPENIKIAVDLEDQLWHVSEALRALGFKATGGT